MITHNKFLENTRFLISMIFQMINGLQCLHKMDILHRDIKPDNFLINIDNNQLPIIALADFGLSKFKKTFDSF